MTEFNKHLTGKDLEDMTHMWKFDWGMSITKGIMQGLYRGLYKAYDF